MSENTHKNSALVSGKTIVVTGCSSGIGAQIVVDLQAHGARVIGLDVKHSDSVDTFIHADLGDAASIASVSQQLPSDLNGLCNVAGIAPVRPAQEVLKINLIGPKMLTYALLDHLSDGASIVNLASLAGFGWPQAVDQVRQLNALDDMAQIASLCETHNLDAQDGRSYFLSKEALIVWTMQNRWTWRARNIRINAVSPGPVDTPLLPDFLKSLGDRADKEDVIDRAGTPSDVAPLVTFLQSDGAAWIRGTNIPCDGGMSAHMALAAHQLV